MQCLAVAALLALGCALHAMPALAGEQDQVRAGVSKGAYKPLAAIVADIQKRHPGRVLDVETKRGPQGELRYEITLADAQGRKQELLVDAATGQVLAQEAEHLDQAVNLAKLAAHLRRVEQQLGNRVVDAEYEVDHGKPRYKLKLARAADATQKVLMDPQSGALLNRPDAKAAAAIKLMPDVLQALAGQFSGLVLEVELRELVHPMPMRAGLQRVGDQHGVVVADDCETVLREHESVVFEVLADLQHARIG